MRAAGVAPPRYRLPMLGARLRIARRRRRRRLLAVAVLPVVLLAGAVVAGDASLRTTGWRGVRTDHFDGSRFRNLRETRHMGPADLLRWLLTREKGPWRPAEDVPPGPSPVARVTGGGMRVTVVGHATTLLQMDGLNILTDPIWSERCSPVGFAGPRRVRPPALRFEDLPPIDVVVLSHAHYDHLDLPTLHRLADRHHPRIFAGLGIGEFLARQGIGGVVELDWWQGVPLAPGVQLTSVPAQHFSNRGLTDQDETLWTGWVFSGPSGDAYFAGDTGAGPQFGLIRERFSHLRLALLPIGAYRPEWFMERIHLSPAQAVEALAQVGAATGVAIHHGTFALADDGQDEPVEALAKALAAAPDPKPRLLALPFGQPFDAPPATAR